VEVDAAKMKVGAAVVISLWMGNWSMSFAEAVYRGYKNLLLVLKHRSNVRLYDSAY
jgi:hypothetical protein